MKARRAVVVLALAAVMAGGVLTSPAAASPVKVMVVMSTFDGSAKLTREPDLEAVRGPRHDLPVISVDDRVSYQRVDGFGATMTDSSAWLLEKKLAPATTRLAMRVLFGYPGLRLNFLRVPMGASDFTWNGVPYSYDDLPPGESDPQLTHFSIAHDEAYTIPAIRQALGFNPGIEILANPWSPPGWMKTNDALGNSDPQGTLLPADYGPLANYFVKFIQAYGAAGVPIADVTPQNEPGNATVYPGLDLTPAQEARLIHRFMAPALRSAGLRTRIYGDDLGLDSGQFASGLMARADRTDLSGIAWHCYYGPPTAIAVFHKLYRGLREIDDECAPGINPVPMPEVLIGELRNWAQVVTYFNIAENQDGGPVQPPNRGCGGCTPLVTVDDRTGQLSFNLNYFQLAQASSFIDPGAHRIASGQLVHYRYVYRHPSVTRGIDDVAFLNPDGQIVLLAYNNSPTSSKMIVQWRRRSFAYTLPPMATATFVWRR